MNAQQIKALILVGLALMVAIFVGKLIGDGDYWALMALGFLVCSSLIIFTSGYGPLLAFGIVSPFALPVPFIKGVPLVLLVLGVCMLKLILKHSLTHKEFKGYRHILTLGFVLFFGWVALRYAMKPVMPNLGGFGQNITGFRNYMSYAICGFMVLLLPVFIRTKDEAAHLVRWMVYFSLAFILVLLVCMVTGSQMLALYMGHYFNIYVGYFGNGWLRFVTLPGLGLALISVSMLPHLLLWQVRWRVLLFLLGMSAVVLGGNRSSFGMSAVMILVITMLQYRPLRLAGMAAALAVAALGAYTLGESGAVAWDSPAGRVLGLVSPSMERATGSEGTVIWRKQRWELAISKIKEDPLLGVGYGGVENAWTLLGTDQFESSRLDIDMATGGIHNGYLQAAYNLGIPAAVIFLLVLLHQIYCTARGAYVHQHSDPVAADLYVFVCANLCAFIPSIFIGTDLNSIHLWFYLALGVFVERVSRPVVPKASRFFFGNGLADKRPRLPLYFVFPDRFRQ